VIRISLLEFSKNIFYFETYEKNIFIMKDYPSWSKLNKNFTYLCQKRPSIQYTTPNPLFSAKNAIARFYANHNFFRFIYISYPFQNFFCDINGSQKTSSVTIKKIKSSDRS